MRFKLDENLPVDAAVLLNEAGHDVHTVYQEGLCGNPDSKISEVALTTSGSGCKKRCF